MSINKITNAPTQNEQINKINEIIDKKLENTATGTSSLTIDGTATNTTGSTNVGSGTQCTANYSIAIGNNAKGQASSSTALGHSTNVTGSYGVALGYGATVSGGKSIQLGYGTNSTSNSLNVGFQGVGNYQLLDGTTGKMPSDRIKYDGQTITVNSNGELTASGGGGSGGASRNIGEIVQSTIPLSDAGLHLLDGSTMFNDGIYSDFFKKIQQLYKSGNYDYLFTTASDWQTSVETYGVCGKFVYSQGLQTLRLPKIIGFTESTIDVTTLGNLTEAGLPNITGNLTSVYGGGYNAADGAFEANGSAGTGGGSSGNNPKKINLDASRSSSIYGNSDTVQPQSIKVLYYIVVANSTKTEIEVDIDEIATDLNNKADKDLSNLISTSSSNFDGQWVQKYLQISDATALGQYVYNLGTESVTINNKTYPPTNYLPDDNYSYEVMVLLEGNSNVTTTSSWYVVGNDTITVNSPENCIFVKVRSASSSTFNINTGIIPVGTNRLLYGGIFGKAFSTSATGRLLGYRRIGTNQ